MQLAAAIQQDSEHPLAKAVMEKAQQQGLDTLTIEHFKVVAGKGVTADYAGVRYYLGSSHWMQSLGQTLPQYKSSQRGASVSWLISETEGDYQL